MSRLVPLKPVSELTNGQLTHQWANFRAQRRLRGLSERLAAQIDERMPQLEAEASSRSLILSRKRWRAYPARDGGPLMFGSAVDEDGNVHRRVPAKASTAKPLLAPVPTPPDQLMATLEASLRLVTQTKT